MRKKLGMRWGCALCRLFRNVRTVLSDVLLLADVLSVFRKTRLESFRLDPLQYFSLSGYSFDCALRHSEAKIELLTCPEMHQMIEISIRGGLATVGSPRYAKANNASIPEHEFESENPTSLIHFFFILMAYIHR